jgi:hypothetical protein
MSESWGYRVVCRLLWFLFSTKNCALSHYQSTFLTISPALFVLRNSKKRALMAKFSQTENKHAKTIFGLVYP